MFMLVTLRGFRRSLVKQITNIPSRGFKFQNSNSSTPGPNEAVESASESKKIFHEDDFEENFRRIPKQLENSHKYFTARTLATLRKMIESKEKMPSEDDLKYFVDHTVFLMNKADWLTVMMFKTLKEVEYLYSRVFDIAIQNMDTELIISLYQLVSLFRSVNHGSPRKLVEASKLRAATTHIKSVMERDLLDIRTLVTIARSSLALNDTLGFLSIKKINGLLKRKWDNSLPCREIIRLIRVLDFFTMLDDTSSILHKLSKEWTTIDQEPLNIQIDLYLAVVTLHTDDKNKYFLLNIVADSILTTYERSAESERVYVLKLARNLVKIPHMSIVRLVSDTMEGVIAIPDKTVGVSLLNPFLELFAEIKGLARYSHIAEMTRKLIEREGDNIIHHFYFFMNQRIIARIRAYHSIDFISGLVSVTLIKGIKNAIEQQFKFKVYTLFFCTNDDLETFKSTITENLDKFSPLELFNIQFIYRVKGLSIEVGLDSNYEPPHVDMISQTLEYMPFQLQEDLPDIFEIYTRRKQNTRVSFEVAYLFPFHSNYFLQSFFTQENFSFVLDSTIDLPLSYETGRMFISDISNQASQKFHIGFMIRLTILFYKNAYFMNYVLSHPSHTNQIAKDLVNLIDIYNGSNVERSMFEKISFSELMCGLATEYFSQKTMMKHVKKLFNLSAKLSLDCQNKNWTNFVRNLTRKYFTFSDDINSAYIEYLFLNTENHEKKQVEIIEHAFLALEAYAYSDKLYDLDRIYNETFAGIHKNHVEFQGLKVTLKLLNKSDNEILEKIGADSLVKYASYDSSFELIQILIQRAKQTGEVEILNLFTTKVAEHANTINFTLKKLLQLTQMFNKNFSKVKNSQPLTDLLDQQLNKVTISALRDAGIDSFIVVMIYNLNTNKPLTSYLNNRELPNSFRSSIVKMCILMNKTTTDINTAFSKDVKGMIKSMNLPTDKLLEYLALKIHEDSVVQEAIREIVSSNKSKPFSFNLNNNYLMMWLYVRQNNLFETFLHSKGIEFIKSQPIYPDILYLHDILESLDIKHEFNVRNTQLLVAEFVFDNLILTINNTKNDVKLLVLNQLYPGKDVTLCTQAELKGLKNAKRIEHFLKEHNIIKQPLSTESITKLEEFFNKPQAKKTQDIRVKPARSNDFELLADDILMSEDIDFEEHL